MDIKKNLLYLEKNIINFKNLLMPRSRKSRKIRKKSDNVHIFFIFFLTHLAFWGHFLLFLLFLLFFLVCIFRLLVHTDGVWDSIPVDRLTTLFTTIGTKSLIRPHPANYFSSNITLLASIITHTRTDSMPFRPVMNGGANICTLKGNPILFFSVHDSWTVTAKEHEFNPEYVRQAVAENGGFVDGWCRFQNYWVVTEYTLSTSLFLKRLAQIGQYSTISFEETHPSILQLPMGPELLRKRSI